MVFVEACAILYNDCVSKLQMIFQKLIETNFQTNLVLELKNLTTGLMTGGQTFCSHKEGLYNIYQRKGQLTTEEIASPEKDQFLTDQSF